MSMGRRAKEARVNDVLEELVHFCLFAGFLTDMRCRSHLTVISS